MDPDALWRFLPVGYVLTVLLETPVLLLLLSRRHPVPRRLFAGVWLTACTYPVIILVLPSLVDIQTDRMTYLIVAETFAPLAECVIFTLAFGASAPRSRGALARDWGAIVVANLVSFGAGELFHTIGGWEWLGVA